MKSTKLVILAAVGALAGCSAMPPKQPQPSCEVMTEPICARVAEAHLNDGSRTVSNSPRNDSRVVPFVVPIFRTDGVLATEVDCYENTDARTYAIVRSALAIPPSSQESVDFLEQRHLCEQPGLTQRTHLVRQPRRSTT